jgi:hypothetical protein
MKNGIHIPASVVWPAAIVGLAGLAYGIVHELPPARRYLKLESY